jgi:hypothetical protein
MVYHLSFLSGGDFSVHGSVDMGGNLLSRYSREDLKAWKAGNREWDTQGSCMIDAPMAPSS